MSEPRANPIETAHFGDDGKVPNNPLPVIIYRGAIAPDVRDPATAFEQAFAANDWTNGWRDGIYPFHHFHSTSHEVLGIARGHGRVRLGGEAGRDFDLAEGDVVVLPAGTGHKLLSASSDFLVVGAYPGGRDWDLIRADEVDPASHDAAVARIRKLPLPESDPVAGKGGPLLRLWSGR
jgi:uncharacterized protein YjlB